MNAEIDGIVRCFAQSQGQFGTLMFNNNKLEPSISMIPDYFYSGDKTLRNILLPEWVREIGKYAFEGCASLQEIILPEGVVKINEGAFYGCTSLKRVIILGKSISIEKSCFENCYNLESINSERISKQIPPRAFSKCAHITQFHFAEDITEIGERAFENCGLTRFNSGKQLHLIKDGAFSNCENLKEVVFGSESLEIIDSFAFVNCSSLEGKIVFPASVRHIGPFAFGRCWNIKMLVFNNLNTEIRFNAFYECHNLTKIISPKPSSSLFYFPFYDSPRLISISSNEITVLREDAERINTIEMKEAALLYNAFGMRLTYMVWDRRKDYKAFKDPSDTKWKDYRFIEQNTSYFEDINWSKVLGLGLILNCNGYCALDIDKISKSTNEINCLIRDGLGLLGLPDDYEWVVYSGGNCGFHIILRVMNLGIEFCRSERYDKKLIGYCGISDRSFIEIRNDHLVLPPSYHYSGARYRFRNAKMPKSKPQIISKESLNIFLRYYTSKEL